MLRRVRRQPVLFSTEFVVRALSSVRSGNPLDVYEDMVRRGELIRDNHQIATLSKLQKLSEKLRTYQPHEKLEQEKDESKWGLIQSFFSFRTKERSKNKVEYSPLDAPAGIYMYGGVGTGKTFMMDLFYNHCQVSENQRQRLHFLDFMIRVHQNMHRFRKMSFSGEELMDRVVLEMMGNGWLLCFDEFQVTDIADAMVIRQLFQRMWAKGLVMVATSNRAPQHLYHNGLQRELFLPFIKSLEEKCDVHSLSQSSVDYRLIKGADAARSVYLQPVDLAKEKKFEKLWHELRRGSRASPVKLHVEGHDLNIPCAIISSRMARFTFPELCGLPLGSADYIALAQAFHTVFISGVPIMTLNDINQARRFILLIDTLYEQNVKLVCLCEGPPDQLFAPPSGSKGIENMPDEVFAFRRTASRLVEMQGRDYLQKCWRPSGSEFLINFVGHTLTEDILLKVWKRYDLDGDNKLDINELYAIMQDVSELKSGHRNVPDAAVLWTFKAMDPHKHGYIEKELFIRQGLKYGMNVWWGGYGDVDVQNA